VPPFGGLGGKFEQTDKGHMDRSWDFFWVRGVDGTIGIVGGAAGIGGGHLWILGKLFEGATVGLFNLEAGLEVGEVLGSVLALHGLEDAVQGRVPGVSLVAGLFGLSGHGRHSQLGHNGRGASETGSRHRVRVAVAVGVTVDIAWDAAVPGSH